MTSSKEILLFRRTLLNPVACLQFQHFVCLKGGFLENDVLFWQEVQRYKVRGAGRAPVHVLGSQVLVCCRWTRSTSSRMNNAEKLPVDIQTRWSGSLKFGYVSEMGAFID